MGEIVLVRHGQASFGAEDYDQLSPLGEQQSEWLGWYFREHNIVFDRALRGSLKRHRQTADGIARALDLPPIEEDPRLDELHYDLLEQEYLRATGVNAPSSRSEFLAHFPEIFALWAEGAIGGDGESFQTFSGRVNAVIDHVVVPDQTILIVTSGGVIGTTIQRALDLSARATADVMVNIHNASVHRLALEEGRLRLSLFNASPHLEGRSDARTFI